LAGTWRRRLRSVTSSRDWLEGAPTLRRPRTEVGVTTQRTDAAHAQRGTASDGNRSLKSRLHGSSFLVASSWHPRDDVAITRHEEIGRVERVGRGCYEDASDLSATSRACRAGGIWRTTRPTDERAALYTASDCRPTNQVSVWQAELEVARRVRHAQQPRSILARMSGVSAMMTGGCYEETAPVEFQLNRVGIISVKYRISSLPLLCSAR